MAAFCAAQGIVVTAYSPLGSGGVGSAGTMVAANEALAAIGAKHGRSAAQVAIAWCVARGIVCIPKSVTESRLKANIDVFFELSEEEMGAIAALDMNERMPTGWGGPKVERDGEMQPRDLIHPLYPFQPDVEF
jgi:diketogulonate reductase-like aldo/keto reductase